MFQSLWADTSNFAFPFLCISWQRCWNTLQRAPLPIRPCACKCVCVCVCIRHVTDSYDGCTANPGLINYTPSGCHMSHWWNTYMESQSPTRTHWADVHICMRVYVCVLSRACCQQRAERKWRCFTALNDLNFLHFFLSLTSGLFIFPHDADI